MEVKNNINQDKEEYKRMKKEYEELCKRKTREENEKWERMVKEVRTDNQVWKIINEERKEWKREAKK